MAWHQSTEKMTHSRCISMIYYPVANLQAITPRHTKVWLIHATQSLLLSSCTCPSQTVLFSDGLTQPPFKVVNNCHWLISLRSFTEASISALSVSWSSDELVKNMFCKSLWLPLANILHCYWMVILLLLMLCPSLNWYSNHTWHSS